MLLFYVVVLPTATDTKEETRNLIKYSFCQYLLALKNEKKEKSSIRRNKISYFLLFV